MFIYFFAETNKHCLIIVSLKIVIQSLRNTCLILEFFTEVHLFDLQKHSFMSDATPTANEKAAEIAPSPAPPVGVAGDVSAENLQKNEPVYHRKFGSRTNVRIQCI